MYDVWIYDYMKRILYRYREIYIYILIYVYTCTEVGLYECLCIGSAPPMKDTVNTFIC